MPPRTKAKVAEGAGFRQVVFVMTRRDLLSTLEAITQALALAQHPWWILGSAAVVLHGADPNEIRDVDVLLDRRDCPAVFDRLGIPVSPGQPDDRFRSEIFHRWNLAALPVDLFAGFSLFEHGAWQPVIPRSRLAIEAGGVTVYIPERAELIAILQRFGRPKDQRRIAALNPSARFPSRSGSA